MERKEGNGRGGEEKQKGEKGEMKGKASPEGRSKRWSEGWKGRGEGRERRGYIV